MPLGIYQIYTEMYALVKLDQIIRLINPLIKLNMNLVLFPFIFFFFFFIKVTLGISALLKG